MTQGALPFKYEEEKKDFGTTGVAGLLLFMDLLKKMGFKKMVNRHVKAKEDKQGWDDFGFLLCLMLLNISGGECVEDVQVLEKDDGLHRLFKHFELRNTWGRRRQKLKRQWRNGRKNLFPSRSAIFRYLLLFHSFSQEKVRVKGKAFIPSSTAPLKGLCKVNQELVEFLQLNHPSSVATLDQDATITASDKEEALYTYKGFKGYQPLNTWWWEQDVVLHTEFRDGNVPAGFNQRRVFEEALSCLPAGVETVYLRSDSAGYQHDLLRYCECGENQRFGRIQFAIGCGMVEDFIKELHHVPENEWRPIHKVINGVVKETGQQWAEVCFVPNAISRSKKGPDYRYLAIREVVKQKALAGMEEEFQKSLDFPNVKLNNKRYKLSGLVTNLKWYGESIIHWYRERCGNSEHVHSEMKESFSGGQLPSGKFGANAAWWWIMVLSLNLTSLLKSLALDKSWKRKRMKRVRYWLINIAGRVILMGKELMVRLTRSHPSLEMLVTARRRILLLGNLSP
ncbi:MAG: IS1380 family transposase [bacterium]|nr:IS1380 family transposase [bacterium]